MSKYGGKGLLAAHYLELVPHRQPCLEWILSYLSLSEYPAFQLWSA